MSVNPTYQKAAAETFWATTEEYIKRGWNDIEPKLLTAALSGSLGVEIVTVLQSYHVPITPTLAQWIPLGIAIGAGYIQKSKAKVQTKTVHLGADTTMEKTITGPITVPKRSSFTQVLQPEPTPEPTPEPSAQSAAPARSWIADAVKAQSQAQPAPLASMTPIPTPDSQATVVLDGGH
jgi:hypothetical protein